MSNNEHGDTHPDEGSEQPDFGALSGDTGQVGPEAETAADQAAANMGDSIVPHGREEPGSDEVVLPGEVLRDTPHTTNDAGGIDPEDYIPDISEGRQSGTETGQPSQPADTGKTVPEAVEDSGKEDGMGFVWHTGDKEADETGDLTVTDILHEDSGKALSDVCDMALNRLFTGNGTERVLRIKAGSQTQLDLLWHNEDFSVTIQAESMPKPVKSPDENNKPACQIRGPKSWEGLLARPNFTGAATFKIITSRHIPVELPEGGTTAVQEATILSFFIPDLENPRNIDWQGITPHYADSEGIPAEALGGLVRNTFTPDIPADEQLAELDNNLISGVYRRLDSLPEIPDKETVQIAADTDTKLGTSSNFAEINETMDELGKNITLESINSSFDKIRELEIKPPADTDKTTTEIPDTEAFSDELLRDAQELIQTTLNSDYPYDPSPVCGVLADMAKHAGQKGNIGVVQQYCNILKVIEDVPLSAQARAYFAAAQLGDESYLSMLDMTLKQDMQDGDITALSAIVQDCADAGIQPYDFISRYSAAPTSDVVKDSKEDTDSALNVNAENKWALEMNYLIRLKDNGVPGAEDKVDTFISKLLTDEFPPEFTWSTIPVAYEDAQSPELRLQLALRFIELVSNSERLDYSREFYDNLFKNAMRLGLDALDDAELTIQHPGLPRLIDDMAADLVEYIKTDNNIAYPYYTDSDRCVNYSQYRSAYLAYHMAVSAQRGIPAADIIREIYSDEEAWLSDLSNALATLAPHKKHSIDETIRNQRSADEDAIDNRLTFAAVYYAKNGDFASCKTLISSIAGATARNYTFVECCDFARNADDVATLIPDELIPDGINNDGITPNDDPEVESLFGTALATSSDDLGTLLDRAKYIDDKLSPQLKGDIDMSYVPSNSDNLGNSFAASHPYPDMEFSIRQLDILLKKIKSIDPIAARDLSIKLLSDRVNSDKFRSNRDLQNLYESLEYGMDRSNLYAIRKAMLDTTDPRSERVRILADYAFHLRNISDK